MSSPPFRILPWDFFASPSGTRPYVETLQISGALRHFELLPRGSRVYIRLAGDNSRLWATLDDNDDPNFVRTFRRAVGSGHIGRVLQKRCGGSSWAYFLVGADSRLQAREWYLPHWTDLSFGAQEPPSLKKMAGIWSERFDVSLRRVTSRAKDVLDKQRLTDQERQFTSRRWLRGSEEDWQQLLRALSLFVPPSKRVAIARRYEQKTHAWEAGWAASVFESESEALKPFAPLLEIINAQFQLRGLWWRWSNHFELVPRQELGALLQLRSSWDWYISWDNWEVIYEQWRLPELTTAHERLEAGVFLRDWLRDKRAPPQVEELLNATR